jgi:hypothetical protein
MWRLLRSTFLLVCGLVLFCGACLTPNDRSGTFLMWSLTVEGFIALVWASLLLVRSTR